MLVLANSSTIMGILCSSLTLCQFREEFHLRHTRCSPEREYQLYYRTQKSFAEHSSNPSILFSPLQAILLIHDNLFNKFKLN